MTPKTPANEVLRKKDGVLDQRSQQIDPAGKHRVDANERDGQSQKQPGQTKRDLRKAVDDAE